MHSGNAASNSNTENNFPRVNQPYTVNECGAYYQPVQGHTLVSQAIFTSMQEASEMSARKSTSVQTSSWDSLKNRIAYRICKTVNKITQTPSDGGSVYSTQQCTLWHLQQHVPAQGAPKQFSETDCFSDKATIHITGQVDKHMCIWGSHKPSLGGTWMAVRRKYILYNTSHH
jgi:hypothetical protein